MRAITEEGIQQYKTTKRGDFVLGHAAMVVLALVLALYFPEIDALLGLLGATCSVSLSFVVPPLLYRRHVVELEAHPRVRRERVLVGVLMTFGAAVAAASVPVTMWELVATVRAR